MSSKQIQSDEEYAKKLQDEWNKPSTGPSILPYPPYPYHPYHPPPRNDDYHTVIQNVIQMPFDRTATELAGKYGFNITTVTWEDNARTKGSVWGPCISDMTLRVEDSDLPVIRSPNYEDLTWDVPIDKIPLVIGNEHGERLRTITLKEYLQSFPFYLHSSNKWKSSNISLLAPRDSAVIMSSQACFLPVPKDGGEAKFNVAIFNYQSSKRNPAVLAIGANEKGTSAQIVENVGGGQKLYFNDNGQRCPFLGQRLSEYRIEKGETDLSKPMSQEEKQKNMLLIIQIPLKHRSIAPKHNVFSFGEAPMSAMKCVQVPESFSVLRQRNADVEDAIIKVGQAEGEFNEIGDVEIERDPDFPIRVTLQFYKATSNGVCDESHIATISNQIKESRKFGVDIGSLVVGGNTGRVTDHSHHSYSRPPWWDDFWLMYKNIYPQFTSESAAALVFKNGRFCNSSLNQCQHQVLDVLGNQSTGNTSTWNLM